MRCAAALAIVSLLPGLCLAGNKLTLQEKIELTRGLMAEYAKATVALPRSREALSFDAATGADHSQWDRIGRENGAATRKGQTVQITKVSIDADRIVLQLNGGYNGGRKWYRDMTISGGTAPDPTPTPIGDDVPDDAPYGTTVALLFHKPLESLKTADVKKLLAPILDFDLHSVTEIYAENLPPAMQAAINAKKATVGMNREQVILALGQPAHKERSVKDGVELEDWVYGEAPGKFTFVTFKGDKAIAVKEEYAGLGTQVN